MKKVLAAAKAEGEPFSPLGGVQIIQIEDHQGGDLLLEYQQVSDGAWKTQDTFDSDGQWLVDFPDSVLFRFSGSTGTIVYLLDYPEQVRRGA